MRPIDRRRFIRDSLATASAVSFASHRISAETPVPNAPGIIDTNVNLFKWPFRALKYGNTNALVAKLKKHRVVEAWAGSFEALFSKQMDGANERLAAECREHGGGFLVPFGSVNLAWPDWEEDVRRCHEVHKMRGIRIFPGYQPYGLEHAALERLLKMTSERGLVLQVVFGMEDPRVHHPIIQVAPVALRPLVKAMDTAPIAKVQLLHFPGSPRGEELTQFLTHPNTVLEISALEGNGAVGRMIGTVEGLPAAKVPVDRILFGSHAPYFPVETALLKLVESPLQSEQLLAVMQGNARRFFSA